jgi:hypothetical protein|nr:hypothetical protein [uncultured Porphyromonas sp.]
MNTPGSQEIMTRFYSALEALIALKKIRGVNTYCRRNNIDRRNLNAQKKDLDRSIFQLSWLQPMILDYGVNARWLITGEGRMFDDK